MRQKNFVHFALLATKWGTRYCNTHSTAWRLQKALQLVTGANGDGVYRTKSKMPAAKRPCDKRQPSRCTGLNAVQACRDGGSALCSAQLLSVLITNSSSANPARWISTSVACEPGQSIIMPISGWVLQ